MRRLGYHDRGVVEGFTSIELLVAAAIGGLMIFFAVWTLEAMVVRANDARRTADIQSMVMVLAAAAKEHAALCNAKGSAPCEPGSLLHECTIYRVSCTGAPEDDVTKQYLDLSAIQDPVYRKPCQVKLAENCAYTFLEVKSISDFILGFATQGSGVSGLGWGHSHRANQQGFLH